MKKNELFVSGYFYFETNAENTRDAEEEFRDACKKAGINTDNVNLVELRDRNGNVIREKKHYQKVITVPKYRENFIRHLLENEPNSEEECFGEDEMLSFTAKFEDGYEVDIKLIGVQYREGESNLPYTEAILFRNGAQEAMTEPETDLFGNWHLETEDAVFDVIVKGEDELCIILR